MKAIALLSGGLDSILAARLIMDQGIEVIGVGFRTPFFDCGRGRKGASQLNIPFHCFDITPQFNEVLKQPAYGYGKHLNPCVDCHRLMVKQAFAQIERLGASFVITGEVLGQRPKSQTRNALNAVAKAGRKGLLLRPLSARLLEETIPEKAGWVKREMLLGLSGRSRKMQLKLAESYGIKEFSSPAGGCLLTDPGFCRRLRELKDKEKWTVDEISLLKLGRHFRLPSGVKVISGRNEEENLNLEKRAPPGSYFFQAVDQPGSLVLLKKTGKPSGGDITTAAAICARYSKEKGKPVLKIGYWRKNNSAGKKETEIRPLSDKELEKIRI